MSLMATLPSSGSSVSSLTSTTSSIALSEIIVGTAITICVLVFLLAVYDVMSDSRNTNTTAALRAFCMPLIVTFCAWVIFEAARYWP